MLTKTEAIRSFLKDKTAPDLARLYHRGMEAQVNVAKEGGQEISQESGYNGRIWRGFTDGETTWKPFRIPYNARSDPEFKDSTMMFDLGKYAEGIGMTGWNWEKKQSIWVAYDFDSIIGHSDAHNKVMTNEELKDLETKISNIPWVTVRKSTGGNGLHIYVFLKDIKTNNHTEHAAVARSVLGMLSAETGLDLQAQVDTCGGNMWVWHRKMIGTDGLKVIKSGGALDHIPANWRDHLDVITGKRRKNLPGYIEEDDLDIFEQLCAQRPKLALDKNHKKLLAFLKKSDAQWWWDQDHWMLVCHTSDLAAAHKSLGFRGIFKTVAKGKESNDHNCFCYPLTSPDGSWVVRRYSQGAGEDPTWTQDGKGWTYCNLNKHATLEVAADMFNGIEDEKGFYHFPTIGEAKKAAMMLGGEFDIEVPDDRPIAFKRHKDGRLILNAEATDQDAGIPGWRKDKKKWVKILHTKVEKNTDLEVQEFSNMVRHLLTNKTDSGWAFQVEIGWIIENKQNIQMALSALGLNPAEISKVMGDGVNLPWELVNEPFQPEYVGDRKWNRDGAQLAVVPQLEGPFIHPTWDRILNQVGDGLTSAIAEDDWCKSVGILTGGDYLRVWSASLFQFPKKKLPYLFFYSNEQRTGKTSFHEMLGSLMTSGYVDCGAALISQGGFNAELLNAILCRMDEFDLQKNKSASNRIKNLVTSDQFSYHEKGKTPYMVTNYMHFIQTGNFINECKVFDGDTRITLCEVPKLVNPIPKDEMKAMCRKEAPAFLATLLNLDIPMSKDPRLNLPVIDTAIKEQAQQDNRSDLESFLKEMTKEVPGAMVLYSDLFNKFQEWLDPTEIGTWSKIRMGKKLPTRFPKGRVMKKNAQFYVGNLTWVNDEVEPEDKLVLKGDKLC